MTLKAAMWVHGTIVEAKDPSKLVSITRKGKGTDVVGMQNTYNWFHFPIATPVILDDQRPALVKVFVFYNTKVPPLPGPPPPGPAQQPPLITDVRVYDGPNKVKEFNNLTLSGDHDSTIDQWNSWVVDPPVTIRYGLGLSVHVHFRPPFLPAPISTYGIRFTSAGADFAL